MTCLIIDDEKLARDYIAELLAGFPVVTLIGQCGQGRQAVQQINELRPELIFLDVQMPGLSGFGVLGQLIHRPLVVFTTAYAHYAAQAFDEYAVDYLLKPLDPDRFRLAVERVLARREFTPAPVAAPAVYPTHVLVAKGGRLVNVATAAILCLEAAGDHTVLTTEDGQYLSSLNLSRLGERLPPAAFLRIHRSTIVHLAAVQEVAYATPGAWKVVLHTGKQLSVGRQYVPVIRQWRV